MKLPNSLLNVLRNILLVLMGIVVALLVVEGASRLLDLPYDYDPQYRCDHLFGWVGTPNSNLKVKTDDYKHFVTRNSRGMHDEEHALEKPDGVFRILVLGDSFAEAREVDEPKTSHQILEDRLNASAPDGLRFEVVLGGVRGWGPAQEYLYLREVGIKYQPDLVLAFWLPKNDLQDLLPDYRCTKAGINCYAPYFAICDGTFDPEPWFSAPGIAPTLRTCSPVKKQLTNILSWVYYHSRLYQYLERSTVYMHPRAKIEPWWLPWVDQAAAERMDTYDNLVYGYQITEELYDQLLNTTAQSGAQAVIAIIPTKEIVLAEAFPAYRQEMSDAPLVNRISDTSRPNKLLKAMLAPTRVPILDLLPAFVNRSLESDEPLYWEEDGHWTEAGNQFAGETIANWLVEQGLVPAAN